MTPEAKKVLQAVLDHNNVVYYKVKALLERLVGTPSFMREEAMNKIENSRFSSEEVLRQYLEKQV